MNSSEQHFSLGALRADQVEGAARFLESEGAGGLTQDDWLRKFSIFWEQNPCFDGARHARGWVVTDENEAILGFLGNIPVRYTRNGAEEPGYWATTWFVAEKARTRSLDLFRQFMTQHGVLFDTTPTPEVERIIARRFKFSRLDSDWIRADYLLPVHLRAFVRLVEWRFRDRPLLKLFCLPACLAVEALTWCRSFSSRLAPISGIEVREIDALPDDLDAWWGAYRARKTFTLVRDAAMMRWLVFAGPFAQSRKVLQVRKGASLLGFVSLKIIRQHTFAYVEMVDLALLDLSNEVLRSIINEARRTVALWSRDIAYLRVNAFNDAMRVLLSRAGFWRTEGRARYYYFDRSKQLSADDIYGTPVDGDRVLFP